MARPLLRLILSLLLLLPLAAKAEVAPPDRATLVADAVTLQSKTVLVAKGHVEVFFKGQHMTATAVTYDQTANRLTITGPIRIDDGKGGVFLADQADLSADLTEGLLTSARIVLQQRLQLAAGEVLRSDGGRYTAMRSVVASTCTICEGSTTPLWEIRAREVVHDATAQQIWFSGATLRFGGVPVMYLPVLRVPDPTLNRATGFLIPKLRTTSALGTGVLVPYFITMGPSRDLTLTPYLTNGGDRTLNLRYRQAFANGTLQFDGAATRDSITPGVTRGYAEVTGNFNLSDGYKLALHGITVSDKAYLLDYGISDADRLDSSIVLTRVQRNLYFSAQALGLKTLRVGESNAVQPSFLTDITFHRRFLPAILGGEGEFEFQTHSQYRQSTDSINDTNGDGIPDGRDLGRVTFKGTWRRNWTLPNGIEISTGADGEADFYTIKQDQMLQGYPYRGTATTGVELRWPWVKTGAGGVSQLIEPVVQLVVAPNPDTRIPNEDSTLVEFDESNLFSLDRFPGADAFEGGTRINAGLNYLRTAPNGWTLGVTGGRVLRFADLHQFSAASGLAGKNSDWLLSWSVADAGGLTLTNRMLVSDNLSLTKAEMRFDVTRSRFALSGGYEYLLADPANPLPNQPVEGRTTPVREIVLDGSYDLTRNWTAKVTNRYDLVLKRAAQAGLELGFRNECLSVDLSLSRRYTSAGIVKPSTDFGFTVALLGFGGTTDQGSARVCRR